MIKNSTQLRGIAIVLTVGVGFIMMAAAFLDAESSVLMTQLIGVFVLIVGLIGFAALLAWITRKIIHRKSTK